MKCVLIKRRNIQAGDLIEFTKVPEMDEKIKVKVLELRRYTTFEEMYKDIPFHFSIVMDGHWKK
jgi:ASC-1-like (ASCH) protein